MSSLIAFKDSRGRSHEMKGNEANMSDGQKSDGRMRWTGANRGDFASSFSCPVVRRPVPAVGPASYLAVHEFQVDSLQRDLQQPTFASFHVLDRKLST